MPEKDVKAFACSMLRDEQKIGEIPPL